MLSATDSDFAGADVFTRSEETARPDEGNEKPETEAKGDDEAKKPKAPKPRVIEPEKPDTSSKAEQIRALAKDLGLTVEDGKVTTAERVKLRQEKASNIAAINQAKQEALAELAKGREELGPRLAKTEALEAAVKGGDYEAIAKNLGFKDWNELQEDQLKHFQDPNHKRLRELEERLQKKEAEELTAREQAEQARAAEQERAAQANYKVGLSQHMAKSADPLVKAMAPMPNFVNAIFNVQQTAWRSRGEELDPAHAIHVKPDNGGPSLHDELKALHDALAPVFGGKAAPIAAATTTIPASKPAPKPPIAASAAPAPRPKNGGSFDEKAWRGDFLSRMEQAQHEDNVARRGGAQGR